MYVGLQVLQKEFGKLTLEIAAAASNLANTHRSPRLFVKDTLSFIEYLIDCGSDITAIPRKYCKKVDIEIQYTVRDINNGVPSKNVR